MNPPKNSCRKKSSLPWCTVVKTAIAIFFAATIIFIIVYLVYLFFKPTITAGDLLTYIATIFSVIGTISLSIITVHLTKKANDIASLQVEMNEYKMIREQRPFVILSNITEEVWSKSQINAKTRIPTLRLYRENTELDENQPNDNMYMLSFCFVNSTENILTLRYGGYIDSAGTKNINRISEYTVREKIIIPSGSEISIGLYSTQDFWEYLNRDMFVLLLDLENRFGEKYAEQIEIAFDTNITERIPSANSKSHGQTHILFKTYKYRIGKGTSSDDTFTPEALWPEETTIIS